MKKKIEKGNVFQVMPHKGCPEHENGLYVQVEQITDDWIYYVPIADSSFNYLDPEIAKGSGDEEQSKALIDSLFVKKMLREVTPEEMEKLKTASEKANAMKTLTMTTKCLVFLQSIKTTSIVAKRLLSKHYVVQDVGDYVSLDKDGFRFVPFGKELKKEGDVWLTANTQVVKYGKFARKFLVAADTVSDSEYEKFANAVKAFIGINGDERGEGKYEFEIVEGEAMKSTYLEKNYTKEQMQSNNLYSSCMRYENCQPYLGLYVNNPDVVKMLVLRDYDKNVAGRALLWKVGSNYAMDRIYGTDSIMVMFKEYAAKNGWYYKSHQSNDSHFDMLGTKSVQNQIFHIPVDADELEKYPYLDTLRYLDLKKSVLTNKEPRTKYLLLRSTSGGYEMRNDYNVWTDCVTGSRYRSDVESRASIDYTVDGVRRRGYTRSNSTMVVQTPEGRDIRAHIADIEFSEVEGIHFLRGDRRFVREGDDYVMVQQ